MDIILTLAKELGLREEQVTKTVALIDEGNTIPFIARYRKEVTGSLDDTILRDLEEKLNYLRNIEKRKEEVKNLIDGQGKLTEELIAAIDAAQTLTEVDDIYRPYRPHRKTRASVAREKGLEPLAQLILEERKSYSPTIEEEAEAYIDAEKGITSAKEALAGACDIIAEDISDNAEYRKNIRSLTFRHGVLSSKTATEEDTVYSQYYEYSEPVKAIPAHRILAINRGEKEEILKVKLDAPKDMILNYLYDCVIHNSTSPAEKYLTAAMVDGYDRLIEPSVEREIRSDMFDGASEKAIVNFEVNLKICLCRHLSRARLSLDTTPAIARAVSLRWSTRRARCLTLRLSIPRNPRSALRRVRERCLLSSRNTTSTSLLSETERHQRKARYLLRTRSKNLTAA